MRLLPFISAVSLALGVSAASAMTDQNNGSYTLSYDETTSFGGLSGWFTSGNAFGDTAGFNWNVPLSVALISNGGAPNSLTFDLPSFTITANAGWLLGNPEGFFGNMVFTQIGGATTSVTLAGTVSVDGGPAMPFSELVGDVQSPASLPGIFVTGYYAGTYGPVMTGFSTLAFSGGTITLASEGGSFAAITAQPQNQLRVSFNAAAVPEPETYAMLLAGLGLVGWLAKRRSA